MGVVLRAYVRNLRLAALWTDAPPWKFSWPDPWQHAHWLFWLLGNAWSIAGLMLGAVVAPSLAQFAGRSNALDQGALVIGSAVLASVLAQSLVWFVLVSAWMSIALIMAHIFSLPTAVRVASGLVVLCALAMLPVVGVGYALHRYFAWTGSGQGLIAIALVGGLLVKTFLIPLIKFLVPGLGLKRFLKWLREDNVSTPKP